uniref:La ribonucleoprotein 4Ab n=1 Tax=Nothobranchius furzeri TaxID=105023 RepID=A0A8C6M365_NOTFU
IWIIMQVTTKGTSLNPNAKVWQEIPAQQNDVSSGLQDSSSWMQAYSSPAEMTEGTRVLWNSEQTFIFLSIVCVISISCIFLTVMNAGMSSSDIKLQVVTFLKLRVTDIEVCKEQIVTEESLRDTLKERLEFCFSRENLSKDLYLISQMDNDQFVPIWTVACMEDIQALTTDMDLILDVLKASPLVQVDEAGEKVRPNHSRCIIILREVPETTPLEEVEALFKNENCPKVLSAEFAHNSSWYITFQSDMDALKAYRYLREEVKTFQGKPVMARIKAINTFFGKNGFRSVDSGVYQQQAQFASPVYMQQVYSSQQQYPVYPVVSPTWSPPIIPHFETPLATFPNNGFMNGYSNNGSYKGNSSSVGGPRSTGRNRYNHRGNRRKREDEQTLKPVPLMEVKAPPPNFDLAASSFPPLPGSVVAVHGEAVAEVRLSDVVRGLKTSTKVSYTAQRKLSYAEVCQRPAKDLPPAPSDNQPLQELKVNTVEEVRPTLRQAPEKSGDKRPPRQPSRAFRGPPGHTRARGYGMKMRENQRGKWFSSQQGGKHSGKEQNIPPTSPK